MNVADILRFLVLSLSPWHKRLLIQEAGGEVARECRSDLWHRVHRQVVGMSVPEIRGYVTAQATFLANAEVDAVLDRQLLARSLRDRVLASAVDHLVKMTIHDALAKESSRQVRTRAA